MKYYYYAYQLYIASEVELDAFERCEIFSDIDVNISFGNTPNELVSENAQTIVRRVRFQMDEGQLLYHLLDGSRIFVSNGEKIVIQVSENPDMEFISLLIRTRAMAAILHQRRYLPLHGSAIAVNGKAVLFIGQSGAGKSTLTGAFIKKGYQYLADDWGVIKKNEFGSYHLLPTYPELRFWEDSFALLEKGNSTTDNNDIFQKGKPIRKGLEKYFVSTSVKMYARPLPIANIYFLGLHQEKFVRIKQPSYTEAFQKLLDHTFAKLQMRGLGGQKEQFLTISSLLKNIKTKTIYRPYGLKGDAFWKMIDTIEKDFLT